MGRLGAGKTARGKAWKTGLAKRVWHAGRRQGSVYMSLTHKVPSCNVRWGLARRPGHPRKSPQELEMGERDRQRVGTVLWL